MSAKTKTFTPKQLARLPDLGYWVATCNQSVAEALCIMNGQVKYLRPGPSSQWSTLLWSCCPTRNQVEKNMYNLSWQHFSDHAAMLAQFPEIIEGARIKAPNDF